MFAKGKQREGVAVFVSLISCMSFNFLLSYGQVNSKKSAGGFENSVVLKKTWFEGRRSISLKVKKRNIEGPGLVIGNKTVSHLQPFKPVKIKSRALSERRGLNINVKSRMWL